MADLRSMIPDKVMDFFQDEQSRKYLILGITALFALLYSFFIIFPKVTALSTVAADVTHLNGQIDFITGRMGHIGERTRRVEALRKELDGYSGGLPDQKDIPQILEELSSIAKKSGLKILSIIPSPLKTVQTGQKKKVYYSEMPIVITAKSGYHQLGQFVANLEKGERFITIEELRIQNDSGSPRQHGLTIGLKTYVSVE